MAEPPPKIPQAPDPPEDFMADCHCSPRSRGMSTYRLPWIRDKDQPAAWIPRDPYPYWECLEEWDLEEYPPGFPFTNRERREMWMVLEERKASWGIRFVDKYQQEAHEHFLQRVEEEELEKERESEGQLEWYLAREYEIGPIAPIDWQFIIKFLNHNGGL